MKTYQDFQKCKTESEKITFISELIQEHKTSDLYQTAFIASQYDMQMNPTIEKYKKVLYKVTGEVVPDSYSANWKTKSNYFHRFVLQWAQYLLGNGVKWQKEETRKQLGQQFDYDLQELTKKALVGGVSFGFWNYSKLHIFSILEFAPLYDEENSALMAGVRFWQLEEKKPLRATLYEIDGYTDYICKDGVWSVLHEKRGYVPNIRTSKIDGSEIFGYENYPSFPIVPLWGNSNKQSEIVGLREQIDCYDFIKNGFANDLDDASLFYWTLNNAGAMDDIDLSEFIQHIKTVHAAKVDNEVTAESHVIDVPYSNREALLDRLSRDLYQSAMAMNSELIANGANTATQIRASYEPLNCKTDDLEYQVLTFLDSLLKVIGITNEAPSFTRSVMINAQEEIQNVILSANWLSQEYMTTKILDLLGDGDKAKAVLEQIRLERLSQSVGDEDEESEPIIQTPETAQEGNF